MTEPLFAAGTPLWPTPAIGPGWQTFAPANGPLFPGPQLFGAAFGPGHSIGVPNASGPLSGPNLSALEAPPTLLPQGPLVPQGYGLAGNMLIGSATFPANAPPPAASFIALIAMRRGQPLGPTTDQEVEDFIYDALELYSGTNDLEVRCESGRVTLTGSVQHKRLKRDVGELAWAIPTINDVQNNVTINQRRRSRPAGRETESPTAQAPRKQT